MCWFFKRKTKTERKVEKVEEKEIVVIDEKAENKKENKQSSKKQSTNNAVKQTTKSKTNKQSTKEIKKEDRSKNTTKETKNANSNGALTPKKITRKGEAQKTEQESEEKQEVQKKPRALGKYIVMFDKESQDWKIKRDGAKRIIDSKSTKKAAIERVRELAEHNEVGFVAKKKDGKFQKKRNIK